MSEQMSDTVLYSVILFVMAGVLWLSYAYADAALSIAAGAIAHDLAAAAPSGA